VVHFSGLPVYRGNSKTLSLSLRLKEIEPYYDEAEFISDIIDSDIP